MDRLLCHHIRSGDDTEANQFDAAQDVRQGAEHVRDELEETKQWEYRDRHCQQQDPKRNVGVRT